jgi:peptidoglycan/LPS O-acetylase OafA/YrhL
LIPLLLIQLSNFAHVTSLLVFSCGIFCQAWAPRNFKYAKYSTILSVVACAAIFVVYAVGGSGNSGLSILFMLIFFMSITSGASIFGFLISKGARRVGAISYGIYILQGIPLWIIFSNSSIKNWSMMSSVHYWIICAASVAILLFFAFLGHFLIEKPFIGFGKKLGSGSPEHKLDGLKVSRFSSK